MTTTIAPFEGIASWERALYAFLASTRRGARPQEQHHNGWG